jgi:ribosomal protein S18 acetylase RimI-like enzyme
MELILERRVARSDEYLDLRKAAGWPGFPEDVARRGLAMSLFGICAMSGGKIIGMGRIVGDNAIYFQIQDVIVDPSFQRSGVGKRIMQELMRYVNENAGTNANVGLMCSKGREKFYEKFGFVTRPGEKFGAGMIRIVE